MKTSHNGFMLVFLLAPFLLTGCGGGGGTNTPSVPATTYTISGQVQNIPSGTAFILQNNGGDSITIPAGSMSFSFPTGIATSRIYNVTVLTQPTNPAQNCTVSNGTGTVSAANVTNIIVDCSWTPTGSLSNARFAHTATLLTNGKVLVTGGFSGVNDINGYPIFLASAELYDPATGVWSPTGSLASMRSGHTATLLSNGKVLVVGGSSSILSTSLLASAELYDPTTGLWTSTGSLANTRSGHTATLLSNGKVLVAGGASIIGGGNNNALFLAGAELYDPATGLWTSTGSVSDTRVNHTATLLPDGKVLVAGGTRVDATSLGSAELYDPATGLWTSTGSLTNTRYNHTATLLTDGKVLVAGGGTTSSAELYDPAMGLWTSTGSLSTARWVHTATLLPNGQVLVAGGENSASVLASTELYDPATGLWTSTGSLAIARWNHISILLTNGQVLMTGGNNGSTSQVSTELYY